MKRQKGFTLIELLVVLLIFGVMMGAVFACLSGGIRVWETAQKFNRVENDTLIGFAILERDLVNAFEFSNIGFSGTEAEFSFPSLMVSSEDPDLKNISTVKYSYDDVRNVLIRKEWAYPDDESDDRSAERLISNVDAMTLRYMSNEKDENGAWLEEMAVCTNFPRGIKIALRLVDEDEPVVMGKTIVFPVDRSKKSTK